VTGGGAQFPNLEGLSIMKPPYGRITAYDMNKGEIAWQIANGETPANVKNHALLQGLNIPKTGTSRTVPMLHAYDKKTGEDIAQIPMPGMQTGVPMTYVHQGRQFILVAVGANQGSGSTAQLVAYALPQPGGGRGAGGRGARGGAGAGAGAAAEPGERGQQ
jgi:quinoprotein glucose dehydrogenase